MATVVPLTADRQFEILVSARDKCCRSSVTSRPFVIYRPLFLFATLKPNKDEERKRAAAAPRLDGARLTELGRPLEASQALPAAFTNNPPPRASARTADSGRRKQDSADAARGDVRRSDGGVRSNGMANRGSGSGGGGGGSSSSSSSVGSGGGVNGGGGAADFRSRMTARSAAKGKPEATNRRASASSGSGVSRATDRGGSSVSTRVGGGQRFSSQVPSARWEAPNAGGGGNVLQARNHHPLSEHLKVARMAGAAMDATASAIEKANS